MICSLIEPKDIPAPYQGTGISILRSYGRRFNEIAVSMGSCSGTHCSLGRNLNVRTSKPPPERPTWYSSPLSGERPVSAWIQVARMRSAVQRASPIAGGRSYPRFDQTRKPWWSASLCFSIISASAVLPLCLMCHLLPQQVHRRFPVPNLSETYTVRSLPAAVVPLASPLHP